MITDRNRLLVLCLGSGDCIIIHSRFSERRLCLCFVVGRGIIRNNSLLEGDSVYGWRQVL